VTGAADSSQSVKSVSQLSAEALETPKAGTLQFTKKHTVTKFVTLFHALSANLTSPLANDQGRDWRQHDRGVRSSGYEAFCGRERL